MNFTKFVKKSKWKQSCYHLWSQRDIKENTKEITLLFFSHQRKNRRFRKLHNSERKTIYREKERRMIEEAKKTSLEQNAINLSSKVLTPAEKSLYTKKGPSFVSTPTDINWCNLQQGFDSFVNKLCFHALKKKKIIYKLIQPVQHYQ